MKLSLVSQDHPVLHTSTDVFDFDNPIVDPFELFDAMRDVMCENRGIGLAAPQCGISTSMFIIGNPMDRESIIPVFNPKIVDVFGDQEMYEEGCLSYPGLFIKVRRPNAIRVRYTTTNNITDTIKFDGYTARIFLHEYDHLQGVVYTERANKFHVEKAKKKLIISKRKSHAK
jgi:peptide deformylase